MKQTETCNQMARRIVPGIWWDERGRARRVDEEVMKLFRLEDTARNRQAVREVIEETARTMGITLTED